MTSSAKRKLLSDHSTRTSLGLWGWGGLTLLALLPLLCGLFLLLGGAGILPGDGQGKIEEGSLIAGGIFFLPGFLLFAKGTLKLNHHFAAKKLRKHFPGEPWRWDYSWNETEATDTPFGRAFSTLFWSSLSGFVLFFFNVEVFLDIFKDPCAGNIIFELVLIVADGIVLWFFWQGLYLLGQALKYGTSRIRFSSFPIFLNGRAEFLFLNSSGISAEKGFKAALRFLEEVYETSGSGKNRKRKLVVYQLYFDVKTITPEKSSAGRGTEANLSFDLPGGNDFDTELSEENPARYWELQIEAETPGLDFEAIFLLPIYAKRTGYVKS